MVNKFYTISLERNIFRDVLKRKRNCKRGSASSRKTRQEHQHLDIQDQLQDLFSKGTKHCVFLKLIQTIQFVLLLSCVRNWTEICNQGKPIEFYWSIENHVHYQLFAHSK